MTKKDFELIADVLASLSGGVDPQFNAYLSQKVAETFATALQFTNSNFDYDRFVQHATYGKQNK